MLYTKLENIDKLHLAVTLAAVGEASLPPK